MIVECLRGRAELRCWEKRKIFGVGVSMYNEGSCIVTVRQGVLSLVASLCSWG
jgi:hypothetical protein